MPVVIRRGGKGSTTSPSTIIIEQSDFKDYTTGSSYSEGDKVIYVHTTGSSEPITKSYFLRARADLTSVPSDIDIHDWYIIANNVWSVTSLSAEDNDYVILPGDTLYLVDTQDMYINDRLDKTRSSEIINEDRNIWTKGSGRNVAIYMQNKKTNFYQVDVYNDYQEHQRDRSGTRKGNPDIRFHIKNIGDNSITWIRIDWKENMSDLGLSTHPNFKMTPEIAFYRSSLDQFVERIIVPSPAWTTTTSTLYRWTTFDTIAAPVVQDDFIYVKLHTYEKNNNLYITLYDKNTIPEGLQYAQIQ